MRREKLTALLLVLAVGGGSLASLMLEHLYARPRPHPVPTLACLRSSFTEQPMSKKTTIFVLVGLLFINLIVVQ